MRIDELEWRIGSARFFERKRDWAMYADLEIYRNTDDHGNYCFYDAMHTCVYAGLNAIEAQCILYHLCAEAVPKLCHEHR